MKPAKALVEAGPLLALVRRFEPGARDLRDLPEAVFRVAFLFRRRRTPAGPEVREEIFTARGIVESRFSHRL